MGASGVERDDVGEGEIGAVLEEDDGVLPWLEEVRAEEEDRQARGS